MDIFKQLQQLANQFDKQGKTTYANELDKTLLKLAQTEPNNTILVQTTLKMFEELNKLFKTHLKLLDYLGEDSIKVLQASFDQFLTLFRTVLRNESPDYDKSQVGDYESHLKNVARELERSHNMKLTPAKVKMDKFLIYDEFEVLLAKLERQYSQTQMEDLNLAVRKARVTRDAFTNIIESVSEYIAKSDLIDIK